MPAQRTSSVWGGGGRCAGGALKLEFDRDGVVRGGLPSRQVRAQARAGPRSMAYSARRSSASHRVTRKRRQPSNSTTEAPWSWVSIRDTVSMVRPR
jgi:hypothetical protein